MGVVMLSGRDDLHSFFGLDQPAFGPVSEPGQLFRSGRVGPVVKEVLAGTAVLAIRGEHGAGKTNFMRVLAIEFEAHAVTAVIIGTPSASRAEVQAVIAQTGGLAKAESDPEKLLRALRHEAGIKRLVLLCDNAETLSADTFHYLASLLRLRVTQPITLQLILLGATGAWPGLADDADLEQLRLASTSTFTTLSMRKDEATAYLDHRLRHAGQTLGGVMTLSAAAELREQARCNPRRLDELAERALLHGYRTGRRRLTARSVRQAASGGAEPPVRVRRGRATAAVLGLAALSGVAAWLVWSSDREAASPRPTFIEAPRLAILSTPAPVRAPVAPPPAPAAIQPAPPQATLHPSAPAPRASIAAAPQQSSGGVSGLVLVAGPHDDIRTLYARVYRGLTPPPYQVVLAANQIPIKPGALVIFPEPPAGWTRH